MSYVPMTLAQIRAQCRAILSDVAAAGQNPTTWFDVDVVFAINQAIADYCRATAATVVEASNTIATTGLSAVISDAISILDMPGLDQSDVAFEDLKSTSWRTLPAGTPRRWVLWAGNQVRVIPTPVSATGMTIRYIQKPTDLINVTDDNNSPDARVQAAHHEALAYAAVSHLLLFDTDDKDYSTAQEMRMWFEYKIGVGPDPGVAKAAAAGGQ